MNGCRTEFCIQYFLMYIRNTTYYSRSYSYRGCTLYIVKYINVFFDLIKRMNHAMKMNLQKKDLNCK